MTSPISRPADVQADAPLPADLQPGTHRPDVFAVESLDMEAQGIAHRADGKVVFIEGALPFERVTANINRKKSSFEKATVLDVLRESSQRVRPACPHFGLHQGACGGCKMQHLHADAQVAVKQRVLEDNFVHLGRVQAERMLRPIAGPSWHYRFRARLSVRYVRKKETVLVGFHERKSQYVADIRECHVLPQHVSDMLMPLRELIGSLQARETCPQIELACGQVGDQLMTALVLRHLEPLSGSDQDKLRAFAAARAGLQWWLQPKGPDTVHLLDEGGPALAYDLPEFGIVMPFKPTDFTQVNPFINRVLVERALRLLDVQPSERVIDWFCGLGNFTLPLATQAREVLGIEGSPALVARSRENLAANQARRQAAGQAALVKTEFAARNLFEMTPQLLAADGAADKWLVDPPREGAFELFKALAALHPHGARRARVNKDGEKTDEFFIPPVTPPAGWTAPRRIVYVSCNPATLARDAGLLVHEAGYRCTAAGVVNMFPHTAHVESMAVFERSD
jgi:23S rRNA (uracil1939-C5)-methyltransferase